MFLTIVASFIIGVAPADSALRHDCAQKQLSYDTVVAIFQTLDGILAAEQSYRDTHRAYLTCNVMTELVSIDSLERTLDCTFPASMMHDTMYCVAIKHQWNDPETDEAPCRVLIINIYNSATENNLPIARLTYCPDTGRRDYEYVEYKKSIRYALE